jgi:hypothetical protein
MGELFRLKGKGEELKTQFDSNLCCLDESSNAGDLHQVLDELRRAGFLECPKDLEIIVYPNAIDDGQVAVITVFSTVDPYPQVVATSAEIRRLATGEAWEAADLAALTVEIIEGTMALANGAIAAVRALEGRGAVNPVAASARCPKCGAEDRLRLEYRHDLLGLAADGSLVLAADGELTDIFCLECGEEVDDVEGPEGSALGDRGHQPRA